ncbi:MAG: alpha/beta hydrolase, partial [Acholeplasma sp.]|nr:alpha/beta hydrolase [Acholeplasma sp.]
MKLLFRILKITLIVILSLLVLSVLGLFIYTRDSYGPLEAMTEEINTLNLDGIEVIDDLDQISYYVDQPKKNIVIVPGGKVKSESYQYLAVKLALSGYDVTFVKTVFNLAIITPNYGARFLKDGIENVLIITGEFDTVLDINDVNKSASLLPDNVVMYEIAGGNHAQFGWYGTQSLDGEATIDTKTQ